MERLELVMYCAQHGFGYQALGSFELGEYVQRHSSFYRSHLVKVSKSRC